jgi:hypothetical protein
MGFSTQAPALLEQSKDVASRVVAGDMSAAMSLVPEATRALIEPVARHAFVAGFSLLLWVAGLAALLGALVVGTLMRNPIPAPQPSLVLE